MMSKVYCAIALLQHSKDPFAKEALKFLERIIEEKKIRAAIAPFDVHSPNYEGEEGYERKLGG